MEREIIGGICAYIDSFYPYIPWLRLNGIKYELEETDMYNNGLLINIYKGKTKQERRLIYHYLNVEVPRITKSLVTRLN